MTEQQTRYLILGGGAAGVHAAAAIRERDAGGRLLVLTDEESCKRPMLSKSPLIRLRREQLALHGDDWFADNRIERISNCHIRSLDPAQRFVETDRGAFFYEKCIYALGGFNFVPPFPGADLPGVLTVRTAKDLQKLKRYAAESGGAAVIGGGVIGLEVALELRRYGLEVTVLEALPRLMPRQLDPDTSRRLEKLLGEVRIYTGVTIAEIQGTDRARAVALRDGRIFPCGLVAVSCGQKANVALAQAAGIPCGRSVIVNERMETGVPDLWACGDCAEVNGFNAALWTQAVAEGAVAGTNAAGGRKYLGAFDRALVLHGGDVSLFSMGDPGSNPDKHYECRVTERRFDGFSINEKPRYAVEKRFYCGGKITGGCILGNLSGMEAMKREIEGEI